MAGLDFWLGDWDAAWSGGRGQNTVTRDLNGRAVLERFSSIDDEPFVGMSISLESQHAGVWHQTWADSHGSYWVFTGGPQGDGTFVFETTEKVDAEQLYKRMVFSNISVDSFDWRWEFSEDQQAWDTKWAISYTRRSS